MHYLSRNMQEESTKSKTTTASQNGMCYSECKHCWCKVLYPKTGIVTAYCAKAKRPIQNVALHFCDMAE